MESLRKTILMRAIKIVNPQHSILSINLFGFLFPRFKKNCRLDLGFKGLESTVDVSYYGGQCWPLVVINPFSLVTNFKTVFPVFISLTRQKTLQSRYEGESHENLKLYVASGTAIFTLLLCRRVVFLHRTVTCRPLFKPWVSLLSTYRQSRCVSNFYHIF